MSDVTLSVIIPLYREGRHLAESLGVIRRHLDALNETYEFCLVDDGSDDDTWQVINTLSQSMPQLRAIRFSRNFGKEAALAAGLEISRGRAMIIMDGDLQHPPELIPRMVGLWTEGNEIVDAVKSERGRESALYKFLATAFNALMCRLSGFDLHGASDFKLLDRRAADAWLRLRENRTFYRGITEWIGFRHARLPFVVPSRADGKSAW
ncbi:MAG: glycosyltransferase family 2 protein [bacterium]|nr:glycosyltransferase family 2 protein [bacterium]